MIKPAYLQKGDTISITAPARKIKEEDLQTALTIFNSWGLNVILSKNIFSMNHSYLAGTDEERLEDFHSALHNKKIKAIICARGGYGSTRIVDQIEFSALLHNPKWIVGFSDITALHLKLFKLGIQSIHGIMPVLFSKPEAQLSVESLKQALFGKNTPITAKYFVSNRMGGAQGKVVGGNLSLLADSLGTSSELDLTEKILIVEEIDEPFYKIDRMFTQMKRAGKFNNLAGLVVGHFTNIKDNALSFGQSVEEIIIYALQEYNFPIAFGFPVGHENPNLAWRHGGMATLKVSASGTSLSFEE